jgi:hypothetical protein
MKQAGLSNQCSTATNASSLRAIAEMDEH